MMLGTGIMALADYLDLPEIYESYGDTNVDRLTNPNLYGDALRVPANAFLDAMTFLGDIAVDAPAAAYDYLDAGIDFYNPLGKEQYERNQINYDPSTGENTLIPGINFKPENLSLFSEQGKDVASSAISNFTGLPSFTTENPMQDYSLIEELEKDTGATIDSKYDSKYNKAYETAQNYVDENAATMDRYFTVNPGNTYEDYDAYVNDMYQNKYLEERSKFEDDFQKDYADLLEKNSIAKFGYNYYEDPMNDISALFGPGLRKLNLGNISGTDIPLKYASEGEYMFPYLQEFRGPEKERLEKLTFAAELVGGLGSLAKSGIKRIAKKAKKQDRISPELQDAVDEYLRD